MESHQIVSRDEWSAARIALLEHEKALTRHSDQVSAERLALLGFGSRRSICSTDPKGS